MGDESNSDGTFILDEAATPASGASTKSDRCQEWREFALDRHTSADLEARSGDDDE
jgi:hypothetical protein